MLPWTVHEKNSWDLKKKKKREYMVLYSTHSFEPLCLYKQSWYNNLTKPDYRKGTVRTEEEKDTWSGLRSPERRFIQTKIFVISL